jgi:hypothetical protein
MAFRVCAWNTDDHYNKKKVDVGERVKLVADLDADAVALQEVLGHHTSRFGELGPCVFTNELLPKRNLSNAMLSGLLFRPGSTIPEKGLIPLPERQQRAVWARVELPDQPVPITLSPGIGSMP